MSGKFFLAVIPARSGSKRVKSKNIKLLGGKPLIAYAIEASLKSKVNETIVSTDSSRIAEVARKFGAKVPFMRHAELAQDNSESTDVLRHAVKKFEGYSGKKVDFVVLLQPTSPLRTAKHIDEAIEKFLESKANALFSVNKPDEKSKFLVFLEKGRMRFDGGTAPKNAEKFCLNGAIYIYDRKTLFSGKKYPVGGKSALFEMPVEDSVDIDTMQEFEKAGKELKKRQNAA